MLDGILPRDKIDMFDIFGIFGINTGLFCQQRRESSENHP